MAADRHFENYIIHNLAQSDLWFMTYRVFWAKKLICAVSFIIWPTLDLQIKYGTQRPSWKLHFNTLVPSAVWLMLCGVFGGKEIIFDVSLIINLGLDLQMQDDHHLAKGLCKLWSHRTARLYGFGSILDQAIAICCQCHDRASFWFLNLKLCMLLIWICWLFLHNVIIITALITAIEQMFMSHDLVGQWWQHVVHWLPFAIYDFPVMADRGRMFHQSEMELAICVVHSSHHQVGGDGLYSSVFRFCHYEALACPQVRAMSSP